MNSIKFLIEKMKLTNMKKLLESKSLTPKEIQKAFKRKDLTLEERVIIALNNNREDVIKNLTDEQINELINAPVNLTRYEKFAKQLNRKQKIKVKEDESFTNNERAYFRLDKINLEEKMLKRRHDILVKTFLILGKEDKFLDVFKKYNSTLLEYGWEKIEETKILSMKEFSEYIFTLLENNKEDVNCFTLFNFWIRKCSKNFDELKQLISSDKKFKKEFLLHIEEYFEFITPNLEGEKNIELSKMIFQSLEVQKKIQKPLNAYIARKQKAFFDNLLQENRSLIVYYDMLSDEKSIDIMKGWLQKYYGNMLTGNQQKEIIDYLLNDKKYFLRKGEDAGNLEQIHRKEDMEYLLKQLERNPKIFTQIDKIHKKIFRSTVGYIYTIAFAKKYNQTRII